MVVLCMFQEGGLYDKLYLCLYYSVSELTKLAQGTPDSNAKLDATKKNQPMYVHNIIIVYISWKQPFVCIFDI